MITSRNRQWAKSSVLLLAFFALTILWGCRAFEPEAVIVNKAPETYIIGAPPEHGGGYFHFHVYWYGSDEDGQVEQFVWAVTDTTLQDEDTTDDEEDVQFNPALDASHLDIAEYTTKTDSIFDFQLNQGSSVSYDITLHMVAKDDFGDFDRTPARLHFFTNALGTPEIIFYRVDDNDQLVPLESDVADTVGFGQPYTLTWSGSTPNIRGYDLTALAAVDSVEPFTDGLFGYKWQLLGDVGGNCVPSLEDCWHPRKFNEASGDSYSYFANVTHMTFLNDNSGESPFELRLPAGVLDIKVNSIDVAGVEVPNYQQEFALQVNYDPSTVVLNGLTDPAHLEDTDVYPYYILLNDAGGTHHPFVSGDRIPDNSYVVVKALYRDDPRDLPLGPGAPPMGLEGYVAGVRYNLGGGIFNFATESSVLDTVPTWPANGEGWAADTLGFLPGPRASYTFKMIGVDEHLQRDGSPDSLTFDVGYPPCVQCIEILRDDVTSNFPDPEIDCEASACMDDTTTLHLALPAAQPPGDNSYLAPEAGLFAICIDKLNGSTFVVPFAEVGQYQADYFTQMASVYNFKILLHGQDHEDERWPGPDYSKRVMAFRYQVNNLCDPFNSIADGGGVDNILQPTWGVEDYYEQDQCEYLPLCISSDDGLWRLKSSVAVPIALLAQPPEAYYQSLVDNPLYSEEEAELIFKAATQQIGLGWIEAVAMDQTTCGYFPTRPAAYNLFRKVRPVRPDAAPEDLPWRTCNAQPFEGQNIKISLGMELAAMESNDGEPSVKYFKFVINGEVDGTPFEFDGYGDCGLPSKN